MKYYIENHFPNIEYCNTRMIDFFHINTLLMIVIYSVILFFNLHDPIEMDYGNLFFNRMIYTKLNHKERTLIMYLNKKNSNDQMRGCIVSIAWEFSI